MGIFEQTVKQMIQREIEKEQRKPLVVSVMGQSGVGKSSLLNALFGTQLAIDAVRPCTLVPQHVVSQTPGGKTLWYYDVPGIGETGKEEAFLSLYRETLLASDVVLWCIHGDTRSVSFDRETLLALLAGVAEDEQATLIGKITLVLTKVDVLLPWILAIVDKDECLFVPRSEIRETLDQKARYFWENLLGPYKEIVPSRASFDGIFSVSQPDFHFDGHFVSYQGMVDASLRDELIQAYQEYKRVWEDLYYHHGVIPCSSRFRYNLDLLTFAVMSKLECGAHLRVKNVLPEETLSRLSLKQAQTYGNFSVIDSRSQTTVYDLTQQDFG